uniref:Uncharacterized protein n=1 Tax=Lepeophtheirus salmonis TaxID=72036 RepID=A0A0K2TXM5_LEPSM
MFSLWDMLQLIK